MRTCTWIPWLQSIYSVISQDPIVQHLRRVARLSCFTFPNDCFKCCDYNTVLPSGGTVHRKESVSGQLCSTSLWTLMGSKFNFFCSRHLKHGLVSRYLKRTSWWTKSRVYSRSWEVGFARVTVLSSNTQNVNKHCVSKETDVLFLYFQHVPFFTGSNARYE